MLRPAVKGACFLLLFLLSASYATTNSDDEIEVPNASFLREKRTYYNYRGRSCGKPGAPQNGWTLFSGITAGNKALYSCKAGYLLVGAKLRICQSNGRWTPSIPACRLVNCGDPGQPQNGKKWLGSTTLGSYVKYKCLPGYNIRGYSYRKCLRNGKWSHSLPTCQGFGCSKLENPQNGRVVVSGGVKGKYSCNQGYTLVGSATRQCVRGQWQPKAPICQVIDCGPLSPPQNGVVEFKSTVFGSIARYQCNQGYRLQGNKARTCQQNAKWSATQPSCRAIQCPALENIIGGTVTVRSRTVGSKATYRCNTGLNLVGDRQRTCQANGLWSGNHPQCHAILCPSLDDPANGDVTVTGRRPGSTATYVCNPGFILDGSSSRTCQHNGQWSSSPPVCEGIQCSTLRNPANGRVSLSGRGPGDTATYSCNNGYRLSGDSTRQCQNNGQWGSQAPTCIAILCPSLDDPANGDVTVTGRRPGSTATYVCNPGFTLDGSSSRTCQQNGQWSSSLPVCRGIQCSTLRNPANGRVSLSGRGPGDTATYSCNNGYRLSGDSTRQCQNNGQWGSQAPTCIAILCPGLDDPANGDVTVTGRRPGSTATYVCNPGFTLDGSSSRTCQQNGQWSSSPPVCRGIQCSTLRNPANGRVSLSGRGPGDTATYSCNNGYRLSGDSTRQCQNNGQWDSQAPTCIAIFCPSLDDPANGDVTVNGRRPGSTATYVCNPGFTLDGSSSRTCQQNGQWSSLPPVCRGIQCSTLRNPANGRVSLSGRGPGDTATYSCNNGYRLSGDSTRQCQNNGQWGSQAPTCIAIFCPSLDDPANGDVTVNGRRPGFTATYVCNPGFTLDGSSSRTCQQNGQWSSLPPVCRGIQCSTLRNPANGRVSLSGRGPGDTATYSCNNGYRLSGDSTRQCQNNGQWDSQAPTCIAILCPSLDDPANGDVTVTGRRPGSTAIYFCNPGFTLDGSSSRICQQNGQWSSQPPICRGIICSDLDAPAGGEVTLSGRTPGSTATYSCQPGFDIEGVTIRTCQTTGRWSFNAPICIELLCPLLTNPQNGDVFFEARSLNSIATYTCNDGYFLEGDFSRQCVDGGEGIIGWSGQEPTCVPIRCDRLPAPVNGRVSAPIRTVGSQATYSCNDGYILNGPTTRVCQSNSEWSRRAPTCEIIDCGILENIQDGRVQFSQTTFESTATYICAPGFSIVGTSLRTCLASGVWSGREPSCQPSMCGPLDNPENGLVTIVGSGIGATATYSCDRGYELNGQLSRACRPSGRWSGRQPTCIAVTCSNLQAPANGVIDIPSLEFNGVATYSCNNGYNLVGVATRTCQASGSWSGIPPYCEAVQCETLNFPENGQVTMSGNTVGATATYDCFPGFSLSGVDSRVCQKSGDWSEVPPICIPRTCERLSDIRFGSVQVDSRTVGSVATYSCEESYILMGVSTRRCQVDGVWSGEEPTCQIFTCGDLSDPANGEVITTGFEVGDTATYVCSDGFLLQGDEMRECQSNGQWSGRPATCTGVTCELLVAPDNGQVEFDGSLTVGSIARYTCLPEYVLRGSEERTCQPNGQWDRSEPVCVAINCPDLSDPERGEVTVEDFTFGSTATYRCEIGYGLVGVSVRSCLADSSWSGVAPTCQIATCNNLEPPQNGNIMTTSTQFGGEATYSCIEGYELIGDRVRRCSANGFWSGSASFCILVNCGFLQPPKDGRISFSNTQFGETALYECLPGYRLVGSERRTCQADGTWSDEEPVCERIDCGVLPIPENADILFSQGTVFRSVATYKCDPPFQLVGSVTRVCLSNMQWSGQAPTCESIECEDLIAPDNGIIEIPENRLPGTTATYTCNSGFNLIGSATRNCLNNGFWTGVVPICQALECNPLKPPRNGDVELGGTIIGSIASYSCFEGYSLTGDEIRSCVDGGVWTGETPACNPIDCGTLSNITNGYVLIDGSTSLGSTASYICVDGTVLRGKGFRQCLSNGQWSGETPACEAVDCGELAAPVNGDVSYTATTFGFTASYTCRDGYSSSGSSSRICQISGDWSGAQPVCIANQCPSLQNPANGQVVVIGRNYLDTAVYQCNNGFVLSGPNRVRTCALTSSWTGDAPTCIPREPEEVDCGQPPFLENGQSTLSAGTIGGSVATYFCFRGFELIGASTTRTCRASGSWSQASISCIRIQCNQLAPPPNGRVTQTIGTEIDSQAFYNCNSGFDLVGVEVRICQENKEWSGTTPTCVERQVFRCSQLDPLLNGELSVTDFTVGSAARYTCNVGYVLVGEATLRCVENTGWDRSPPTCQPVDCGTPPRPLNGNVMALRGTTLGSRAMYSCNSGYILQGSLTRVCETTGRWSGSDPTCSAMSCGGLPDPLNGFVTVTDEILGSVATYTCQTGYSLVGTATRECTRSGWSGIPPTCTSRTPTGCGNPGTPESGSLVGEDYRIGATVYYECNSGYRLVGAGSRQCESSGTWTGTVPQCVESIQICREGTTVYDDCQRRCTCVGGALINCCRVRKDFASLTISERKRYTDTVLAVATDDRYKSKYESLINLYSSSVSTAAQNTDPTVSQFFAWNRYFLLKYEDLLQEVNCRVTIPYWDWTALPMSPYLVPVWNPDSGFGDSARSKDQCVENGPFRVGEFEVVDGGCLRRDYRMQMFPSRAIVEQDVLTLPTSDYAQLHQYIQLFIHVNVRCFVGGQMCSDGPADDPAYILHLAQLDTIYTRWQNIDLRRVSILSSRTDSIALSTGDLSVSDFSDNSDLPDGESVCYAPAEFKSHVPRSMLFMADTLEEMTNNSEMRMTCVTDEQMSNLHMPTSAVDFMHQTCTN